MDEGSAQARKAAFIEQFELEKEAHTPIEDDVDEGAILELQQHRRAVWFWSFMGVLGVAPFILSGALLYMLGRYDQIIGEGGLEFLASVLSDVEVQAMSQETGIPELEFFVSVYDSRHVIIALIFTFFFGLIAILVLIRGLMTYFRNR